MRYSGFFQFERRQKQREKTQNEKKNRLHFIHPRQLFHGVKMCSLLISRRESLHHLNNHGVEVFTDLLHD